MHRRRQRRLARQAIVDGGIRDPLLDVREIVFGRLFLVAARPAAAKPMAVLVRAKQERSWKFLRGFRSHATSPQPGALSRLGRAETHVYCTSKLGRTDVPACRVSLNTVVTDTRVFPCLAACRRTNQLDKLGPRSGDSREYESGDAGGS